jgi:hypothetical protein
MTVSCYYARPLIVLDKQESQKGQQAKAFRPICIGKAMQAGLMPLVQHSPKSMLTALNLIPIGAVTDGSDMMLKRNLVQELQHLPGGREAINCAKVPANGGRLTSRM